MKATVCLAPVFVGVTLLATACTSPEPKSSPTPEPRAEAATPQAKAVGHPALLDPSQATLEAPKRFSVQFETTRGDFTVRVTRAWAPRGADRFYNLVQAGFFEDVAFFRVVPDFVVQFGLSGDPRINAAWSEARFSDDPVKESNRRGRITFATAGPNTRTTQLFINTDDNSVLDSQGFAPFGEVVEGMSVVDQLHAGYGQRPDQGQITLRGNAYLSSEFPRLDYVKSASVVG